MAPYHSSSNGLAERAVQTFKSGIQGISSVTLSLCWFLFTYHPKHHYGTIACRTTAWTSPTFTTGPSSPSYSQECLFTRRQANWSQGQARQLKSCQKAYVENFGGGSIWIPGEVQEGTGPVSYLVRMADGRENQVPLELVQLH